jgi:non-ribosomal peptide synthase protein (TIGR01720 family)
MHKHQPSESCSTLVELVRMRALDHPQREAFSFLQDGETQSIQLTYSQLDSRARALAAQLQSVTRPGERVLIFLPPGLDFVTAFLGCLYAGNVVVPGYVPRSDQGLVPLQPLLKASEPRAVLTTGALKWANVDRFADIAPNAQLLAVDEIPGEAEEEWRPPTVRPGDLAWLQYTSGSTAAPKGVMYSHRAMLATPPLVTGPRHFTSESRTVLWIPLHFSGSILYGILQPLYVGFPATLMPPSAFLERPVRWLQAISRFRATHSLGPNFAFDLCARVVTPEEKVGLDLSSWIAAMCGGEAARSATFDRFVAAFGQCGFRSQALANAYGLSEALGIASRPVDRGPVVRTYWRTALERGEAVAATTPGDQTRTLVGCGEILPGERAAIVDPASRAERAPGQIGELWVAGPTVTDGYWNRPDETDETFHAFLAHTGEGPFLRTGDLGFIDDGELFITGRLKEIIIIRGRNLYPQDIEQTVEGCHPVLRPSSSAAFSVEISGEERLVVVCEVEPDRGDMSVVMAVRRAIAATYDVQAYAVALVKPDTIPKTSTGKIQRAGTRAAFLEDRLEVVERSLLEGRPEQGTLVAAPTLPTEETLVSIWQDVLGIHEIGVDDDFFELGGDSLLSIQVMVRARQAGMGFTIEQLVEHPTIRQLAGVAGKTESVPAEQGTVTGSTGLLPHQHRFFEGTTLNLDLVGPVSLFDASERIDPVSMKAAISALLEHHDALRTRFTHRNTTWQAAIAEREEQRFFSLLELPDVSGEQEARALRALATRAQQSLSISEGPLLRAILVDRGPNRTSRLLLCVHHLVMDGFSMGILLDDLELAYRQLAGGEHVRLPPKTTSVQAWTRRLAEYADSAELRGESEYWLAPVENPPALPLDMHGDNTMESTRKVEAWLTSEETRALVQGTPRVYGAEITDVVLTALVQSFSAWTGCPTLPIDMRSHGREALFPDMDVSRTVGWFTSVFPLRLTLGEAKLPGDAVRTIATQLRQVPHRGIDHDILRFLGSDVDLSTRLRAMPESQVRFNYQTRLGDMRSSQTLLRSEGHIRGAAHYPTALRSHLLAIFAGVSDSRFRVQIHYSRNLHTTSTIERLARSYVGALREIASSSLESAV